MKILLSWPYALGQDNGAPDVVVVLIPSKELFTRLQKYMRRAFELEEEMLDFIRMDIGDWQPLFIDSDKLVAYAEELDTGMFHEIEVPMTQTKLKELARSSDPTCIESCVAFVEKERVGWKFYVKHWDVPCYTGALDREFVEGKLQ